MSHCIQSTCDFKLSIYVEIIKLIQVLWPTSFVNRNYVKVTWVCSTFVYSKSETEQGHKVTRRIYEKSIFEVPGAFKRIRGFITKIILHHINP